MAFLTVVFTKSVVEGVLAKAQSLIEAEPKLRRSAQRDLFFITDEFKVMQSFLNLARPENRSVMAWVSQIRELAYDLEDSIEFIVHLDNRPNWWWGLLPSCIRMAAVLTPDQAVAEIQQFKSRVELVSSRNTRYNLIADHRGPEQPAPNTGTGTTADLLIEAREVTKRQGFADLSNLITQKDDGDHVVAVWGTCGDLGTTSVMRKTYNDPEICQKFTCRAWVKLVQLFNPQEFIQELISQFYANSEESHDEAIRGFLKLSEGATHGDYLEEFVRHVNEVKYLIVLEDLPSLAEWDVIRTFLPYTKNGSWIIVSTQQFEIASLCMGQSYQAFELKQFSNSHLVYAFTEGSQGDGDKAEEISAMDEVCDMILTSKTSAATESIIGRESEIKELCRYISNAHFNSYQVISVWGIAGVGKSALIKNLFCNRILSTRIFQKYGWVDVSHPFNLRDLSRNLLLDFHSESLQANGKIRIKNPIQECRDIMEQQRCLVVIDNLQSKEEWDLIKAAFLSRPSSSIVIAITTEVSIARWCADKEELVFNVKGLHADTAFDLFHQEVNRKNPFSPLNKLKDVKLLELIDQCGGLSKVIVEIAGVLAEKTIAQMDTICSNSDRFIHTLATNPEYHSLQGLFGWIYSYILACPDSLKPCIFYLSFFPRNQSFRRRRVLRRWVAEGYSKDSKDNSAEQIGEMLFAKLLDLSIIQHPPQTTLFGDTRVTVYRVNGFIREYIISWQHEENLLFELTSCSALTTERTGRHLIIRETWERDRIVFENINFSRLWSLTVFGRWKSFFISESMKLLRVLDLEDASGVKEDDLKDIAKLLCRLKFLSLRGCNEIYSLPSSFGNLTQLQTLDIRNTPIVNLPASITKLHKLQYIRAGTSVKGEEPSTPRISLSRIQRPRRRMVGVEVPGGIYKLTALHTFGVVNIGKSGGKAILKELEDLTQLRKLGVSGINGGNSEMLSSAISGHIHLESLSVQLDNDSQNSLYHIYLPFKSLQSLKLHGPVDRLPVLQIDQLSKLKKLDLEMNILTEDAMKLIGCVPKLHDFRVKLLQDSRLHFCVKENGLELPAYQNTKILEIACSSSLDVSFGSETMRSLELLKAHYCNGSSVKFYGLRNLCELKEVLLKGCFDNELKADLQSQLTEHPMRPVLMLEE